MINKIGQDFFDENKNKKENFSIQLFKNIISLQNRIETFKSGPAFQNEPETSQKNVKALYSIIKNMDLLVNDGDKLNSGKFIKLHHVLKKTIPIVELFISGEHSEPTRDFLRFILHDLKMLKHFLEFENEPQEKNGFKYNQATAVDTLLALAEKFEKRAQEFGDEDLSNEEEIKDQNRSVFESLPDHEQNEDPKLTQYRDKLEENTTKHPLPTVAFNRLLSFIEHHCGAMQRQVERFGGLDKAIERGHLETLIGQLNEISSAVRTLERRLK